MKEIEKNMRKLSMTGRLCYLFMCIERYLLICFPERDWTPVAKRCWQWTKNDWVKGWDIYSAVVPEFLFEFDNYKQTNELNFDGTLFEKEYLELIALFDGLAVGNGQQEIEQVLMLPIEFGNICEGASLSFASYYTMEIFNTMQQILLKHNIAIPDIRKVKHMAAGDGWGSFVDSSYLSIIINNNL